MRRIHALSYFVIVLGVSLTICATSSFAAGDLMPTTTAAPMDPMPGSDNESEKEQSWYREQASTRADSLVIVQQKAQIRAQQRMDRMASLQFPTKPRFSGRRTYLIASFDSNDCATSATLSSGVASSATMISQRRGA